VRVRHDSTASANRGVVATTVRTATGDPVCPPGLMKMNDAVHKALLLFYAHDIHP